jgi:hypothetical protein
VLACFQIRRKKYRNFSSLKHKARLRNASQNGGPNI